ncbi:MAG TPA: DUF58 domain-containing protein [Anaerolineales bacterium]
MPIQRWLPLFIIIFYLGIVLRSPFLTAFSSTLLVIFGIAYWWHKHALDGVRYTRRFRYTRGFPGEHFPVRLEIENNKLLPLSWLRVTDPWPKAVGPEDERALTPSHIADQGLLIHAFSLRWFERARRMYELYLRSRGVYKVGPVQVQSGDFFGIYKQSDRLGSVDQITVFPTLIPLEELKLPPENPFGDQRSRRRFLEDPNFPMGVREYRPEDGFRRVHWPATARTGQLQVKVFQPTSALTLVVCLNVLTYQHSWEGINPALFERLLSIAATLLYQGIEHGYRVGLISNGCLSNSDQPFHIPPGRSPKQLGRLLEALAGASPVMAKPFENFLMREIPHVPYGSTLVVVTALTSPALVETLSRLKKHERQITLFSLAEEPPPDILGVRCLHMPFKEEEV